MSIENFVTDWTEVNGDLAVIANKCTWNSRYAESTFYVWHDYGSDYFDDFEHQLKIYGYWEGPDAHCAFWALSSGAVGNQADLQGYEMTVNNEGVELYTWGPWSGTTRFRLKDHDTGSWDQSAYNSGSRTRYVTFIRDSGTNAFKCEIYTDAARTNLEETLTITYNADTYRYMGVAVNRGEDSGYQWDRTSGYIEDLELIALVNPYPVNWLRKDKPTGYACFFNQYLRAKVLGYEPLKLPDGTVW